MCSENENKPPCGRCGIGWTGRGGRPPPGVQDVWGRGSFVGRPASIRETVIKTVEEGIKHMEAATPSGTIFHLAISDAVTFAGVPDTIGAGMAVLLDKIPGLGYAPDGLEQRSGFRVYAYKRRH